MVGYFYSIITELDPTPREVVEVVEKVRRSGACVFFVESTLSPRMMETVVKELGGRLGGKLYTDSIGPLDTEAGTYVGMMMTNLKSITGGLSEWRG